MCGANASVIASGYAVVKVEKDKDSEVNYIVQDNAKILWWAKLFIDGLDAFSEYGIFVEQYGYKALVQMPSFKKLSSTEWPEYDGEEVDLSAPSPLIAKHFRFRFALPIF